MGLIEEQYIYYERLLSLQYWATRELNHKLKKGELREKFIKQFVLEKIPNCQIEDGIICGSEDWQSTQMDFIKLNSTATRHSNVHEIDHCLLTIEIKSNARKSELEKLNSISRDLKRQNPQIMTGIFCYRTELEANTIIKKFGIPFDDEIEAYGVYNSKKDVFKEIDFCFSLDIDEEDYFNPTPFLILRDTINRKCQLFKGEDGRAMRSFIEMLKYEGA